MWAQVFLTVEMIIPVLLSKKGSEDADKVINVIVFIKFMNIWEGGWYLTIIEDVFAFKIGF